MAADSDPYSSTSKRRFGGWIAIAVALPMLFVMVLSVQSCAGPTPGQTSATPVDRALPAPALKVSKNSRYFVDAAGDPFFWMADTAWGLALNLTRDEVVSYLDKRKSQGFNVIQTVAVFNQAGGPGPNRYGDWPYDGSLSHRLITDGADPNDSQQYDYWDHLDFIIDAANARGMRVALAPVWANGQVDSVLTEDNASDFGQFIGARYRDKQVLWILGGDHNADGDEDIWATLAAGIAHGVTGREGDFGDTMMTYHPAGGYSSVQWFRDVPWLTFNMIQGGHCLHYGQRHDLLAQAYTSAPTRPFLDGEPLYSGHPYCWKPADGYSRAIDIRRDAYWAAFAGAAGNTYGDHRVWQFAGATGRKPELGAVGDWRPALDDDAAWQMRYLVALMQSHPWWKGRPDDGRIVADPRADAAQLAAMSATDGSYAMVYSPDGAPFDADLSAVVAPGAALSWFDPRTGRSTAMGVLGQGPVSYTPPTTEDWVLVADTTATPPPTPSRSPG